uniref:Uncharacterized protein n=1 Tax=Setaria italica TaxID=4555 RepID=K3YBI1_SETIT
MQIDFGVFYLALIYSSICASQDFRHDCHSAMLKDATLMWQMRCLMHVCLIWWHPCFSAYFFI